MITTEDSPFLSPKAYYSLSLKLYNYGEDGHLKLIHINSTITEATEDKASLHICHTFRLFYFEETLCFIVSLYSQ